MKKVAIGFAVILVLGSIALAILARSVLTGENVRAAVAAQLSSALGQPVTIGALGASIYPRVTMDLADVAIGQPARIQLHQVHVGTDFRALLSRRVEHADVRVDGARIELPLPNFGQLGATDAPRDANQPASKPPVEIASIDEIVLTNVAVVSGDRTLSGDIELVPEGSGVQLRRVALAADETKVEMTGMIDSLSPIKGRVEARANEVNFDRLLNFFTDFAGSTAGAPPAGSRASRGSGAAAAAPATTGLDGSLTFDLTVGRATTGDLLLTDLRALATVSPAAITFSPLTFGVFGGRYEGTMHLNLGDASRFRWQAKVKGINTGELMAFAKSPNTITGTLGGTFTLEGAGLQMEQALRTSHGAARVDITDGSIAGLALVRTVVVATSGRGGHLASAASAAETRGNAGEAEKFSRLGATLALANGVMSTRDFAMTSTDIDLTAVGAVSIASMTTKLDGQVQLSEELSKKSGTDLYRYTQQDGRVTLPATVSGPLGNLTVRIDVAQVASRAIRNRATEEINKAIERNLPGGLRGLFPKRPPK